ncbi:hypothetical protein CTI12_AA049820 [Artemisia annua]|uniref:Retrotransposon gag domain-containing protein n=1 Tax=Artemisia annua TaxID=35608 RepID=A0A2U1QBB9_ARTAN|nr:hypothetical protein CTI12_AA049820 [Artemisia annua]
MALTINDYLTSVRCEPGIVRPVLEENIKFDFWELRLDELKRYRFAGEDNEEAHEHISRVSEIIDLFQAPKVSRDDVMMMAFPFSLKGKALTWTPRKILQQLEGIRKFQQNQGETLFSAWERFEDLLFKCPEHKLNKHEQLQIFYNGMNIETRRILDFKEPIPKMTAAKGLEKIDEIARHSSTWHAEQELVSYKPDELCSILKNLEKKFIRNSYRNQRENQETIWGIKMEYDGVLKSHVSAIRKLEAQVGNLAKTIKDTSAGELLSTTETNPETWLMPSLQEVD